MSRRATTEIEIALTAGRKFGPFLRRWMPPAVELVSSTRLRSLSIAVVGDARMSAIHQQFLRINGPTDVITFELDHDSKGRPTAGEVVICVGEARRQSRVRGTAIEHELLLYAVHGVLHLSGYDDLDPAAYRRMHRAEDRILRQLGIGAVFAAGTDHTPVVRREKESVRR